MTTQIVSAVAQSSSSIAINFTWDASTVYVSGRLFRNTIDSNSTAGLTPIYTAPAGASGTGLSGSFTDTGLTAGTTYYYFVQAYNELAGSQTAISVTFAGTTQAGNLTVPNMIGLTTSQASTAWTNAGFTGSISFSSGTVGNGSSLPYDTVYQQSPTSGTSQPASTTASVTYYSYPTPVWQNQTPPAPVLGTAYTYTMSATGGVGTTTYTFGTVNATAITLTGTAGQFTATVSAGTPVVGLTLKTTTNRITAGTKITAVNGNVITIDKAIGTSGLSATSIMQIYPQFPTGITAASTGVISGTATQNGTFYFTVYATASGASTSVLSFTWTVGGGGQIFSSSTTSRALTVAKRNTASGWVDITVRKRYTASGWVDITN